MKRILPFVSLLALVPVALGAANYRHPLHSQGAMFHSGEMYLTPQLMAINHEVPIGANFEYLYSGRIGFGGDVAFVMRDPGWVIIAPDVQYHFDLNVANLDLSVGAGPSLMIGYSGGSDFAFKPFVSSRFFFSPQIAAYFRVLATLGDDSSLGAAFGVSFQL